LSSLSDEFPRKNFLLSFYRHKKACPDVRFLSHSWKKIPFHKWSPSGFGKIHKEKIAENLKKAGFFLKKLLQFEKKYGTISGYMDENRAHPLRRRFQAYHSIPQKAENTEGGKD